MKVKLLKKLRNIGRNSVNINSIYTDSEGIVIGMNIGFNDERYKGIFHYGDTESDIKEKAYKKYLELNIGSIRKKYFKYTKKCKLWQKQQCRY